MDGQHHYEINLKHGDLQIILASDDVYFISRQMDKWFRVLLDDSYVPIKAVPPAPAPPPPVVAEPPPPPPPPPVVEEPPPPPPPPPPVAEASPPDPQPVPEPVEPLPLPPPPAIDVLESVVTVDEPTPQRVAEPAALDQGVEDDFEAVMDSLMKDLEEEEDEGGAASSAAATGNGKSSQGVIDSLADLCDRSHADRLEDYLVLSAYYLTFFEGQDKFSLKRINSMLVKSGMTPVNHSVLETVLSQGHLSMVPDLTGTAETTEYTLTEEGQQYASRLL